MDRIFFEVHCSKFKPDPIRYLSQASEKSISHRVLFLCICKHPFNCLFSQCVYCFGVKDYYRPSKYVYDVYYDCVICPENQVLNYSTTNRDGYKEFKSKGYKCEKCPTKNKCTKNAKSEKTVTRHIWSEYIEMAEDIRCTPKYKGSCVW